MEKNSKTPRLTRSQSRLVQNAENKTSKRDNSKESRVLLEKLDLNILPDAYEVRSITEKLENVSIKTPRKSRAKSIKNENFEKISNISNELIGRQIERKTLTEFLTHNITNFRNANMYISGSPGTGKTFVVSEVMKNLVHEKMCEFYFLNCMDLLKASNIYIEMFSKLTGTLFSNYQKAANQMEIHLKSRSKDSLALVFVLDEIDQLITKNESILYRVFNWVDITESRLTIIGIANSLDLVERMLPDLTLQNCRPHRMNFPSYTEEEITAILSSQIGDTLDPKQKLAVKYCSKKVSAHSGDARVALDLYKRALEFSKLEEFQTLRSESVDRGISGFICPESPLRRVLSTPQLLARKLSMRSTVSSPSIKHVNRALDEVKRGGDAFTNIINIESGKSTLPLHQKLALCAGLILSRRQKSSGMKQIKLGQLYTMYLEICQCQKIEEIDMSNFVDITTHLESRGLVRIQPHKESRQRIFTMNLDKKGIEKALSDEMLLTSIMQKFLSCDDDSV